MLLIAFIGLQVLDGISTWWFLLHGVAEANPLIRALLSCSLQSVMALGLAKVAGITLAGICWWGGRHRLLARINIFYAAVVAWNMLAIVLSRS